MAYKRRRFRRIFKRRGTIKRRYRKIKRTRARKSGISKAKRFIRYGIKKLRARRRGNFITQFQAHAHIERCQQSFVLDVPKSQWNGSPVGHFVVDFAVQSLMTDEKLADLKANWYHWKIMSFCVGVKFLTGRNFYRFTNNASTLANHFWQPMNTEEAQLYCGFFRDGVQQTDCANIDPDTSGTYFSSIIETNCYKRLHMTGAPVIWKWYNSRAYQGVYSPIGTTSATTALTTAFAGSMPSMNEPHGLDIMLVDRDRIPNTTGTEEPKLRFQVCVYAVISVRTRKPTDY